MREQSVDCLVAIGGGSTTGLAKALAVRTGLPQVIVPTTYAGSEVTSVLGETEDGRKTTRSGPHILPETVVYDVDLALGLPVAVSVTSAVNAMAHAVEALYAPKVDPEAREDLLRAARLAGDCLGAVGMGLHHKLCPTLGGAFDMPHAATHTVVLPHVMAYNAPAVPEVMFRIAQALGTDDAARGVHDLVVGVAGPTSLRELDMAEADLAPAAGLATAKPYPNPPEPERQGVEILLVDAWHGRRPAPRPEGR
ncbi:iron-containing alcohol dehydrogenase [Nocardiopsis listeri]|uniref:iron-containing alcohol dehydrogenase n=1 Tax=Nocardiopsis listeri TaxID=53440 RepID=UPI000ACAF5E2|nr:iron-containing alcohol dehydrogenase [Nocardiopsis listeri]